MAASSLVQIRGYIASLDAGSRSFEMDIANSLAPEKSDQIVLASGDNTISPPDNSIGCIIIFDPTSTTTKKLKGNAGDTGVTLSDDNPTIISRAAALGTFIINSSAADTGKYTEIVWF